MKRRLHKIKDINFKLVGAIAGAVSVALHPVIVRAENTLSLDNIDNTTLSGEQGEDENNSLNPPDANSVLESIKAGRLRKVLKNKNIEKTSHKGIQPFQPDTGIKLPSAVQKLAQSVTVQPEAGFPTSGKVNNNVNTTTKNPLENVQAAPELKRQNPTPGAANKSNSVKILSPSIDAVVDVPAATVILQFPTLSNIELRVNGELVDKSLIGRTETDANLTTQTWYGVSLKDGENIITAQIAGTSEVAASVKVEVRGAPKSLKIETVEARIAADGRSTATVKGELIDANGNRSNRDAVVTLVPTAGEFIGADYNPDLQGFQVQAKNGQFKATLKSSLQAQTVRIRATANDLEAYTQLQFETALRPSLMTGVLDLRLGARSTDYFGSMRDFLRPRPQDSNNIDTSTQLDVRSSFFATGKVGNWLFTGAYDSQRNLNEDCNCDTRLFRNYQFSEQNYPVYGDSSTIDVITPSIDSVYARFERSSQMSGVSPDYFMWGDYNTEEFARGSQQFTSITRQLHGFKANYNLGNFQITGFYGNNVEAFQRDTIAPDGTSGFYFLSRRLVQPGSESVFLELEELNRPGTVIKRKRLNISQDYEIDYDRGTILFREPILRTEIGQNGEVLVRRIVATYQQRSEDAGGDIYAGRLQYNLARGLNTESWIAGTYLQENQGTRDFKLYGADAMFSFGGKGRFLAEYARSENESDLVGEVEGDALRAELEGEIIKGVQARAYYRYADVGFANNATISFVPGQTRYGAQIVGKLSNSTNLRLQYDHEDNFGVAPQPLDTLEELLTPRTEALPGSKVDNELTTISAGIQQRVGKGSVEVDWVQRDREDRIGNSLDSNSNQLRSRLSYPLTNSLTLLAQNELSLSSENDGVYPDRTILGLNWALTPGVNLTLSQQFYTKGQFEGQSITNLSLSGEHKLGTDTTITGRYSILGGASEFTTTGAIGLNNRWKIAPGLRLNLAYERVFGDFFGRTAAGNQFAQPFAIGQSAYAVGFNGGDSYSIGLEYTDNPSFQASGRYEYRSSSAGSNTVISAGATGKLSRALTALVRYQQAGTSNQKITSLGDTASLKVGLAYRDPSKDKFNALLRYEYRKNPATIPDSILLGSGTGVEDHTFALEAIYAPNWQWEFYGKYALRNSTTYLADDLAGTSSINLGQFRATYRLGYSMDLVGEARLITQKDYTETGFVIETGYYLTPNLRLAGGYVFGKVDDRDFSGTRSAGGPYLGLTLKINELFDGFGLQKVAPRQQQESLVQTLKNVRAKKGTGEQRSETSKI